ncbi:hypothetical protein K504DRAFT_483270 [Pleomassaria siparia CBS 279.74]|uniref:Nuclear envelope protein n=1 Tax=Pleomassaria siparia CBS 279.74 TaxID=1314801 RepID=A0A6G1K2J0_9PLEO|nr:hypothetical protein K504DRAFT_483270 [Pleomassaria siparia CBS 279.74]
MAILASQARPYRDFLTPVLHSRFTKASLYTFALCYFIAIWMGKMEDLFWSWFPIGPAGMRASLIFICSLMIYVLRVAQWHVGQRSTESPSETFKKYTLRKATFYTIGIYALSAFLYGETYIHSRTPAARLSYTEAGKAYERIKLNERPVYLRCLFLSLAVAQGIVHIWKDYDKIQIPLMRPNKERKDEAQIATVLPSAKKPLQLLRQELMPMAKTAGTFASATLFIGSVVYFLALRKVIWSWHYRFARNIHALAKTSKPSGLSPFLNLIFMFAVQGTLLALLWQFTNTAFDAYITQEPLKKGKPITSDSKDPNGSLLNGLKSKKPEVKAIAFWELALITDSFNDRRKTIYGELDRKKAPTFKQVTDICLAEINEISNRINAALDPMFRSEDADGKKELTTPISLVPQISQPIKNGQIAGPGFAPETRMQKIESVTSQIARAHSSPQNAQNAQARKYLKQGQKKFEERAQEAEGLWVKYTNQFAASPFGWPFRTCIRHTANVVVNGAPYSRQSSIVNAITTLTNLTVASLKEDEYGQFNTEVPQMVRVFTTAIKKIEEYMESLQVHWTDVDCLKKPEAERKDIPEVNVVLDTLKEGLERILGAFNEYLSPMGMSRVEIQEAKKLIAKPSVPEIEERRRR